MGMSDRHCHCHPKNRISAGKHTCSRQSLATATLGQPNTPLSVSSGALFGVVLWVSAAMGLVVPCLFRCWLRWVCELRWRGRALKKWLLPCATQKGARLHRSCILQVVSFTSTVSGVSGYRIKQHRKSRPQYDDEGRRLVERKTTQAQGYKCSIHLFPRARTKEALTPELVHFSASMIWELCASTVIFAFPKKLRVMPGYSGERCCRSPCSLSRTGSWCMKRRADMLATRQFEGKESAGHTEPIRDSQHRLP